MDVTVTHVNEACHLHLLRLRRLSPSLRGIRPTATRITLRLPGTCAFPVRSRQPSEGSVYGALRAQISSASSRSARLPAPGWIVPQPKYGEFDSARKSLFRTIGSAVTPIHMMPSDRNPKLRIRILTGFDKRMRAPTEGSQTSDDP